MVVRDFQSRDKCESALVKKTREKGKLLVKHLASTDACEGCTAEAMVSLDLLYTRVCSNYEKGKIDTAEFKLVEQEVCAIARRLAAIAAFAAVPDYVAGGRQ